MEMILREEDGGGGFDRCAKVCGEDTDTWIAWLMARIPELEGNGAYRFWIRQALKGYHFEQIQSQSGDCSELIINPEETRIL